MGSNPILAAIYQRNYRATPAGPFARGRQLLPNFYQLGAASSLRSSRTTASLADPPAPETPAPPVLPSGVLCFAEVILQETVLAVQP
jgi:hypothetical protein